MTWVALDHARALRSWLGGAGPVSGEAVCAFLDLPLSFHPFAGRTRAIYWNGEIVVRTGLPPHEIEDAIYHEVGHHLIHGPRGGYDFWRQRDRVMWWKQERQAREFALFAGIPGDILSLMLCDGVPTREIAREYGRSRAWLRARIELAWECGELDAVKRQVWVA